MNWLTLAALAALAKHDQHGTSALPLVNQFYTCGEAGKVKREDVGKTLKSLEKEKP